MLEVQNLSVGYDQIEVLHDISFKVQRREIVTLVGANGAGKTTLLLTISGILKSSNGKILFNSNEDLTKVKSHDIVKKGIIHVPEGRGILTKLSVYENLLLGVQIQKKDKNRIKDLMEETFNRFPILYERRDQKAGLLSGGEQQMLAVSRALLSDPKILLLDEPSMGLAPIIVEQIYEMIREISKDGVTILLVEQNARKALEVADRGYVLENGHIVLEGDAKNLLKDNSVISAYLGN
ncbi:ABC transporter ATP-binding protein [Bacillus sp. 1P10SD]|uniref:ABC transporter ATP-binding protein n=1 Tax=Bacillus sp. 1P10SD TaxID=3132265 RepID=UPI0039A423F2